MHEKERCCRARASALAHRHVDEGLEGADTDSHEHELAQRTGEAHVDGKGEERAGGECRGGDEERPPRKPVCQRTGTGNADADPECQSRSQESGAGQVES